jgi:CDP-glucose 4,6-dehydratase
MEDMVIDHFWKDRKVLVTGHTGFKGSWLALLLKQLGAETFGYALDPETKPSLFVEADLVKCCHHKVANVKDGKRLTEYVQSIQPEVVFHLAAQPLVRRSYEEPVETWKTNVLGTVNLLESLRTIKLRCAVVIITTDKVYENKEWHYGYRETDQLGGHDPYSSSKAAVELAVASWRSSFLNYTSSEVRLASARAGNVIGGGDWSENRIVPDLVRHLSKGLVLPVRNLNAVRPWQHVLDPLYGYMNLAENLYNNNNQELQSAFNFGPGAESFRTVRSLIEEGLKHWQGKWENNTLENAPHEAGLLNLTIDKARSLLDWKPRWSFEEAVSNTIKWYHRHNQGELAVKLMQEQIRAFLAVNQ